MKWKIVSLAIVLAFILSAVGVYASQRIPPSDDPKLPYKYSIPVVMIGGFGGFYTSINFSATSDTLTNVRLYIMERNGNVIGVDTRSFTLIGYGSATVYLGDGTFPGPPVGSALLLSSHPLAIVVHTSGPHGEFGTYLVPHN